MKNWIIKVAGTLIVGTYLMIFLKTVSIIGNIAVESFEIKTLIIWSSYGTAFIIIDLLGRKQHDT
jgi:hypothetical protein